MHPMLLKRNPTPYEITAAIDELTETINQLEARLKTVRSDLAEIRNTARNKEIHNFEKLLLRLKGQLNGLNNDRAALLERLVVTG